MPKKRIAAIEVASNAPRMMIAEAGNNGKPRIVESVRANLALGIDTYNQKYISEASMRSLCEILLGFRDKMEEYKVKDYRVLATSAVREAVNRDFVLARIKQLTGFECQILSNSEERYHHNMALAENFNDFDSCIKEGALVLDLGAGSLQVSAYYEGRRKMSQNLRLGYLRLSELFSTMQNRSEKYWTVLYEYIGSHILAWKQAEQISFTPKHLIVIGNDLNYLQKFFDLASKQAHFLQKEDFEKKQELLLRTSSMELSLDHDVPSDIAEILLPASIIISRFLNEYHFEGFYMPPMHLSEGILLDMAKESFQYKTQHDQEEDLLYSVEEFAKHFSVDLSHVKEVERNALAIFDAIGKKTFAHDRARYLLQIACYLSGIGQFIHSINTHLYSAEIIGHSEFVGLSERDIEILTETIRYIPGNEVPDSPVLDYHTYDFRLSVLQLLGILRVAEALAISRTGKITALQVKYKKAKMTIHLHSKEDLSLEIWSVQERLKLIEELFGLEVQLKAIANHQV